MEINTRSRSELKSYFVRNAIPTESNFADLIDGALNQRDDGIVKQADTPLSLLGVGANDTGQKPVLRLYQDFGNDAADWTLKLRASDGSPGLNLVDQGDTSRLFIDQATGNVGIGTITPSETLAVNGSLQTTDLEIVNNEWAYLDIRSSTPGTDAVIRLIDRDNSDETHFWSIHNDDSAGNRLDIRSNNASLFLITPDGQVGIGTTSPTTPLAIKKRGADHDVGITQNQVAGGSAMELTTSDGTGKQATRLILSGNSGNADIAFYRRGRGAETRSMLIRGSDGHVGIGTIQPDERLHVNGFIKSGIVTIGADATGSPRNYVTLGSNNHGSTLLGNNLYIDTADALKVANSHKTMAGTAIKIPGNGQTRQNHIEFWTTPTGSVTSDTPYAQNTPRMVIDPSGNVGIGTTAAPVGRLQLINEAQNANGNTLIIGPTNSANLRLGYDADYSWIQSHGSRPLAINPIGNNVGIGTSDPTHIFHVATHNAVGLFESTGEQAYLRLSTKEGINNRVEITNRPGGRLSLWTAGGKDVLNITKGGNVGIGTTTPANKLNIDKGRVDITTSDGKGGGGNRFNGLHGWNAQSYRRAQLVLSSGYSDLIIASSQSNNGHGSTLTFATYNPSNANDYRKWVINQGNWGTRRGFLEFGYSDAGGRTNPHSNINNTDTVLTLDGINKRVGISVRNPLAPLHLPGGPDVSLTGHGALLIGNISGLNIAFDNNEIMARNNGNTSTLALNLSGGNVTVGGKVVQTSDLRLKEDIKPLTNALAKIVALNGIAFKWRIGDQSNSMGLIAQEVEKIFPEVVEEVSNGLKGISYSSLIAPLIEAIKEQQEEINILRQAIVDLKAS